MPWCTVPSGECRPSARICGTEHSELIERQASITASQPGFAFATNSFSSALACFSQEGRWTRVRGISSSARTPFGADTSRSMVQLHNQWPVGCKATSPARRRRAFRSPSLGSFDALSSTVHLHSSSIGSDRWTSRRSSRSCGICHADFKNLVPASPEGHRVFDPNRCAVAHPCLFF